MTLTALLLIIASAFLHATWNLVGKRERMTLPFFGVLATCGAIASAWLFAFMPFSPLALTRSFRFRNAPANCVVYSPFRQRKANIYK